MAFEKGDRVVGEIYKGDKYITSVKAGGISINEKTNARQFDVAVGGYPGELTIGDTCRLVTEDGEAEVVVSSMMPIGQGPNQATFIMFSFVD